MHEWKTFVYASQVLLLIIEFYCVRIGRHDPGPAADYHDKRSLTLAGGTTLGVEPSAQLAGVQKKIGGSHFLGTLPSPRQVQGKNY